MNEVILATLKSDGTATLYPEVLAAVGGELHEGMVIGSLVVNPNGKEGEKIRVTIDSNTLCFFDFLSTRRVDDGNSVTYYANIP